MLERRLTLFTIFTTFCLLTLGGFVHNTESSLACPDWPLCYGQVFPEMKGEVLIEHSHRLLATLVGFLSILLTWFTFKRRSRKIFKIAATSLALVVFQGILGGITVVYQLPTIVSTTHLGFSLIYFCFIIYLYFELSLEDGLYLKIKNHLWNPALKDGLIVSTVLVYLQILLGAFMRHSGAGVACGLGTKNSLLCLDKTTWKLTWWPSFADSQLHMVHRYFAIVVTFVCFYYMNKWIKYLIQNKETIKISTWFQIAPLVFIVFQVLLGVLTVALNMSIAPTTAHLSFAALTLGSLWFNVLVSNKLEKDSLQKSHNSLLRDLLSLAKPKLSALVIGTAFIGIIVAPHHVNFFTAIFSLFYLTLIVAGACTLNCYIERDIDAVMERTKVRPLPEKRLNPNFVLSWGVSLSLLGHILMAFHINFLTAALGLLATALYLFVYTPLKQSSNIALFVGAISGAIPPLMGWTIVMNNIAPMGLALFGILFVWQLPHFLAISIYLEDDYRKANLKIFPISFGVSFTRIQIFIFTLLLLGISVVPFLSGKGSYNYLVAACILGGVFSLLALFGFRIPSSNALAIQGWAKNYFWGSIIYLPLLLCSLIFFK